MLMALLYGENDQLLAAAPACDQVSLGNQYWLEIHSAQINSTEVFETAYLTIADPELRNQLMLLGIDQAIDGAELTKRIDSNRQTKLTQKAA